MTDLLTAIKATIPPGDPSSEQRKEWCKAAMEAAASVCLEHSRNQLKDASVGPWQATLDAAAGLNAAADHAFSWLLRQRTGN